MEVPAESPDCAAGDGKSDFNDGDRFTPQFSQTTIAYIPD
jgi:hypothetical protein